MRRWCGTAFAAACALCASAASAQTLFVDEAWMRGLDYVVVQGAFGSGPFGQYGCGVLIADLDGDGFDDIVAMGNAAGTLGFFRNDGTGHFVDVSALAGLPPYSKPSGIVAGDYDADGDLDLLITRWLEPSLLLRNDGDFRLADVSVAAGIAHVGAGGGCAFGDYDGDGWIDIAVANRTGTAGSSAGNRLYRNRGDGTFIDVAALLGVTNDWPAFQCVFVNVDGDDDLDLYVANDKGAFNPRWNRLYRNLGDGHFAEDHASGAQVQADAMGVAVGDLTGDGVPELYIPNIQVGNFLLVSNDGGLTYANAAAAAGVAANAVCWGSAFLDGDNDGDLDLVTVALAPSANFYFENLGPWPMADRTLASGFANFESSYCLAVGDLDGDGDEDLLVQDHNAPLRLYINRAEQWPNRHWVRFRAMGRGANTFGIGTRVEVVAQGALHWRVVAAGTGFKSQSSYALHVGLGPASKADEVRVRFPKAGPLAATTRVLRDYAAGALWPLWPPERLGDADGDGVRSAAEFSSLLHAAQRPFGPDEAIFDFDGDGDVDGEDAILFRVAQADLDGDGAVGPGDLAILLKAWGGAEIDWLGDGSAGANDLALLLGVWGMSWPAPPITP